MFDLEYFNNIIIDKKIDSSLEKISESEYKFKKKKIDGFDFTFEITYEDIGISISKNYYEYQHSFSQNFDQDSKNLLDEYIEKLEFLVTGKARFIELLSNNKAYKWILEFLKNETWESSGEMFNLFYNYFGTKSKKIYIN